jgi:hypothetical protein
LNAAMKAPMMRFKYGCYQIQNYAKRKEMKNSRTIKDKDNKIIPYPWGRH